MVNFLKIRAMNCAISKIPDEILVDTLGYFSEQELLAFRPPDRRFYAIWISALKKWNRPGTPLYLAVTIMKNIRGSDLKSNRIGGLFARCLQHCQIPHAILSNDEEYEGRPNPVTKSFRTNSLVQGATENTGLPFFSVMLKDKEGQARIWTVYQQWRGRESYWNRGRENPEKESGTAFLTDKNLVRLARIILGIDEEYSINRDKVCSTDQTHLEPTGENPASDEAC